MTRTDVLLTPEYWITKIQTTLFDCAAKFMSKTGKNRSQLAEHLGVSKGYVSQVLSGDYDHRISKFVELSLAFGYVPQINFIPVEDILQEDNDYSASKSIIIPIDEKYTKDSYNQSYLNLAA